MFVHKLVILPFMLIVGKVESWTVPTAIDIQTSLETCEIANPLFLNESLNKNTNVRCFAKELGFWSDDGGFQTQRFVKFLNKHHQPVEISIVIDYCNKTHKHTDPDKWAEEAFYCFARGRMGQWINEFIKNVYKNKISK